VLHELKSVFNIDHLEVIGQELKELILNDFFHSLLRRFATSSTSISRLGINESCNHSSGLIEGSSQISIGVETKHQRVVLGRHTVDECKVTSVVGEIGNSVIVFQRLLVKNEVSSEDLLTDEEVAISEEQRSVFFLGNLTAILDGAAHLLHGLPLVLTVL